MEPNNISFLNSFQKKINRNKKIINFSFLMIERNLIFLDRFFKTKKKFYFEILIFYIQHSNNRKNQLEINNIPFSYLEKLFAKKEFLYKNFSFNQIRFFFYKANVLKLQKTFKYLKIIHLQEILQKQVKYRKKKIFNQIIFFKEEKITGLKNIILRLRLILNKRLNYCFQRLKRYSNKRQIKSCSQIKILNFLGKSLKLRKLSFRNELIGFGRKLKKFNYKISKFENLLNNKFNTFFKKIFLEKLTNKIRRIERKNNRIIYSKSFSLKKKSPSIKFNNNRIFHLSNRSNILQTKKEKIIDFKKTVLLNQIIKEKKYLNTIKIFNKENENNKENFKTKKMLKKSVKYPMKKKKESFLTNLQRNKFQFKNKIFSNNFLDNNSIDFLRFNHFYSQTNKNLDGKNFKSSLLNTIENRIDLKLKLNEFIHFKT